MKCSISNIANVISESIPNPAESEFDIFVGLEHYDSGEVKVTRYGSTQNLVTAVKVFRKGDILLARRNVYLKRAGLVDFDGVTSGDSIVLRVKDDLSSLSLQSEDIRMYLPFVLNTEEFWNYAEKYSDGTMSKRLSPKTLLQYEFDIPDDVTEKNRLLWQAYKTKESYKAMILATDEMVKSQFIEMFGDTFQNERGWTYKKLPEVSTIVLGSTPSSSNAAFWDGDVKWITPAELSDDSFYLYDSERHITEEGVKSTSLKPFPAGTVILSTRAPIGKTAIAGCEMYCNQGFKNFVCDNTINPVYLFYLLRIHNPELQKMGTGSTFLELSKKAIEQISISVPPKELQDEFEQFYKQADKSKFDGLKSQFIEMFGNPVTNPMGWSTKPLCQVAPESPSNTKMKGRVWVLNLDMIESNSGCIINKVFEDSDDLNSVAAFDEGNVLFSKLRPYLNKVTIPDGKGYATTELVPLRPHTDELRQHFLSFLLRTDEFVKYADGIATGTKMPRMPMTALREFKCILPPTELQDLFCGISKQADKSKYLS